MKAHRPGLIDALRWRWAFRRQRQEDMRTAIICAVIFVCLGVVGEMDYRDQLAAEADAQAARAEAAERDLLACMNGQARWTHDDPDPHRRGEFSKVVILCQKAEELRV